MNRLLIVSAAACAFAMLPILPSVAAPLGSPLKAMTQSDSDTIIVKGGGGHGGGGHGVGRGGGGRPYGWNRGRKVGWGGRGCPPGLFKQGRC